jgi:hypothetical protein
MAQRNLRHSEYGIVSHDPQSKKVVKIGSGRDVHGRPNENDRVRFDAHHKSE